jgi:hypothetical protein
MAVKIPLMKKVTVRTKVYGIHRNMPEVNHFFSAVPRLNMKG